MSTANLKARAKSVMPGNWGLLIAIFFVYSALESAAGSLIPGLGALVIIGPLSVGYAGMMLSLIRLRDPDFTELFNGFYNFVNTFIAGLLVSLFTALWSMLFVIPGIVKGIAYSQTFYILNENPEMDGRDAIAESCRMMEGHKMDFFLLQLSFLPWMLLCVFVIPVLYVVPYMSLTNAAFYEDLKNGADYTYY